MAPPRRPSNARPQKTQPIGIKAIGTSEGEVGTEPPRKKRKYVPGGPGGGGRYIEVDIDEVTTPVKKTSKSRPRCQASSRPRTATRPSRPVRESKHSNTPLGASNSIPATPHTSSRPPKKQKANNNRRYASSAAAALAAAQGDGYKPREERGWEEFHPELDIDARLMVYSANEVDGIVPENASVDGVETNGETEDAEDGKRRPSRPRGFGILNGVSTPEVSKIVPPPGPNPQERLTLPKPSFELKDPFQAFEQKDGQQNYVDRTMASVGYQESDLFTRHERRLIRMPESAEEDLDLDPSVGSAGEGNGGTGIGRVEYDMDEQDAKWLEAYNAQRKIEQFEAIKPAIFEITMTKIEKEWHALEKRIPKPNPKPPQTQRPRSSSAAAVNGELAEGGEDQDSKCAVCDDGDCENANAIVFCDGCDLAVHQECYGVPYIPEGQWLCRKCQLIGRGQPSCIFCPNTEGAFKQTNTSKWAHVVCAVWIPEVSIGNPSLMEPISDVENVPKSRWKLNCYICRQRMGACIQCSNKNCFVAFHVTCGRRAQLYLKMKLIPGAPAIMDSNGLKAYCDKHVPLDWQEEYNTDSATAEAMEYYKDAFQGKVWPDSQAVALSLRPDPQEMPDFTMEASRAITPRLTLTLGGNKRKKVVPKTIWKLPSGAPVIPQVLLDRVSASLQRFTVRQRRQYAEDACKYWTLKREARRGAALLKRLQLQLETFSSMEMTRRNFAGMGVPGNVRLRRRIEFADKLSTDVDKVRMLCDQVKKREHEKLKNVDMLRHIVDVVYFPIPPLLWPIFQKALALDGRGVFHAGLEPVRTKLEERAYTSVSDFSRDVAQVFTQEIGVASVVDTAELQLQISGRAPELSIEQREKRTLAKRILKAIQPWLEEALKKESELNGQPFEKELKDLDVILESNVLSRRGSLEDIQLPIGVGPHTPDGPIADTPQENEMKEQLSTKEEVTEQQATAPDGDATKDADLNLTAPVQKGEGDIQQTPQAPENETDQPLITPTYTAPTTDTTANEIDGVETREGSAQEKSDKPDKEDPPTQVPLVSPENNLPPLAQGGIQWYMQPFDPVGTTIHEERWMGRDVLRGMSEELSEMDEDEMRDFFGEDVVDGASPQKDKIIDDSTPSLPVGRRPVTRRWRG